MSDWKAKTPEERADIRGQALMKDIISIAPREHLTTDRVIEWIGQVWNGCMDIAEKRLTEKYPAEQTPKPTVTVTHLSDEQVASGISKEAQKDDIFSSRNLPLRDVIVGISVITEKEYKPKKFRYGVKGTDGNWYSTFFKNHFAIAQEAKNKGKQARILYEVGEYNGKPQYTIQSVDIL